MLEEQLVKASEYHQRKNTEILFLLRIYLAEGLLEGSVSDYRAYFRTYQTSAKNLFFGNTFKMDVTLYTNFASTLNTYATQTPLYDRRRTMQPRRKLPEIVRKVNIFLATPAYKISETSYPDAIASANVTFPNVEIEVYIKVPDSKTTTKTSKLKLKFKQVLTSNPTAVFHEYGMFALDRQYE